MAVSGNLDSSALRQMPALEHHRKNWRCHHKDHERHNTGLKDIAHIEP